MQHMHRQRNHHRLQVNFSGVVTVSHIIVQEDELVNLIHGESSFELAVVKYDNQSVLTNITYITAQVYESEQEENGNDQLIEEFNQVGERVVFAIMGFGLIVALVGFAFAKKIKNNASDGVNYLSIIRFGVNLADFWSDIVFTFILYLDGYMTLFICGSVFIGIPFVMSCIIAIYLTNKWQHWKVDHPSRIIDYVKKYRVLIFGLTLVSNFDATPGVLRSKLFYLDVFYFPLKRVEFEDAQSLRFVNILLFENIPQVAIQFAYVYLRNGSNIGSIVFISMVLSLLSIILQVMRFASTREKCQKTLVNLNKKSQQGFKYSTTINTQFDILSQQLKKYHAFCYNHITTCLKSLLKSEIINSNSINYKTKMNINSKMSTTSGASSVDSDDDNYNRTNTIVNDSWNMFLSNVEVFYLDRHLTSKTSRKITAFGEITILHDFDDFIKIGHGAIASGEGPSKVIWKKLKQLVMYMESRVI